MKVTTKIERKLKRMQEGTTFKYKDLGIDNSEFIAATKAVERLIGKGNIKRISTGTFYKPKQSLFGELIPSEEELLKPYLFRGGKRIGYVTGTSLYNRMGLTTQVPRTIKIASKVKRISTKIGKTQVKPVKSYVDVTNENYYLLEVLDALKDFKSIPDLNVRSAIVLLKNKITNLKERELFKMIKYSLEYPPRTRALLGAILEFFVDGTSIKILESNLNPLTSYRLGIVAEILPTGPKWKIR